MSADHTSHTLNQLDKEIATLEKKSADLGKKEANARSNATRTMQGIPKNASISTLRSKQSQIDRYNDEATRTAHDKADNDKKIADKRTRRSDVAVRLQREEAAERKKSDLAQKAIQQQYERRINELTSMLSQRVLSHKNTGQQNIFIEQSENEFDVFISHASEDKEGFVDELVKELRTLGIRVWYDVLNIAWGDSLRSKIDEGLRKSRFGIVVISKDYIKKFWTNVELDGLFQIESVNGKTILPIWHNISKKEVQDFSPTIAGKLALNTTMMNASEIAQELYSMLSPDNIKNEMETIANE